MNATPAFPDATPQQPNPLESKIQARIQADGPVHFRDYMAMALYDPELGYYSANKRVGKAGDFITSVSVGRCFGMLLTRRIYTYWQESGSANTFHIIEPGAHDGALCVDILTEASQLDPSFFQAIHYHLIDTTPALIEAQQNHLSRLFPDKFTSHTELKDLEDLHGAILSNELIDAFPVDIIRFEQGQWWQMVVDLDADEALTLVPRKIDDTALAAFCASLGQSFPEGYTTEYNPGIDTFTQSASRALKSGLFITIDYGHTTADYYHPDRTTGTLQTYYQHQKAEDPLVAPGEIDITCHVDFSRLQSAAESHGFHSANQRTQASYLTGHARSWLLDIENPDTPSAPDTPNLLRQFQTLIHPAMLGTKFTVLEMLK